MQKLPSFGDRVKVWPAAGVRVQDGAEKFGRFLAANGREVIWDVYWHRRFLDGAIHLHDPVPQKGVAKAAPGSETGKRAAQARAEAEAAAQAAKDAAAFAEKKAAAAQAAEGAVHAEAAFVRASGAASAAAEAAKPAPAKPKE